MVEHGTEPPPAHTPGMTFCYAGSGIASLCTFIALFMMCLGRLQLATWIVLGAFAAFGAGSLFGWIVDRLLGNR
jgi:hypothetical protein